MTSPMLSPRTRADDDFDGENMETPRAEAFVPLGNNVTQDGTTSAANLGVEGGSLSRRRSSISLGIERLRYAGGVNSLENFARSWTRAGAFIDPNATPPSVHYLHSRSDEEAAMDSADEDEYDGMSTAARDHSQSIFNTPYGSIGSHAGRGTHRSPFAAVDGRFHPGSPALRPQDIPKELDEREPLLKAVAGEDGHTFEVILSNKSTLPQTVFNEVNVLIGIGLLSLPLGLKHSGWVFGLGFLTFAAVVTNYTAKLLAKCLNKLGGGVGSYGDIAAAAFPRMRNIITILFSMELLGACVALVVLFADTMHDLIPGVSKLTLKIIAGVILTPLSFLPLNVLSFNSILGIVSCFSIVGIVFIDGLWKPDAPGSLRDPMPTYLWPRDWTALPLSFGLLMSPWGGHGVFPAIYSDMRHPHKYNKSVDITYIVTSFLDFFMAIIGILMFGDLVRDEVTSSVFNTKGYPEFLGVLMVIFIAIIPISKTPLNAQPIIHSIEDALGIRHTDEAIAKDPRKAYKFSKTVIRILTNIMFVVVAIIFPSFDRIIALVGSFLCFTICVILPVLFYLKLYGDDVPMWERILGYILVAISTVLAITGTIASLS